MSSGFKFDEATHTYRLDGQVIPSVTQVLWPIRPDFFGIPPNILEAKRRLGVAVHLATELDDFEELDDESTSEAVMGYVMAWRQFKSDTGAEVIMTEQKLYSRRLRFAGTLDGVVRVRDGDLYLLDRKTSISMSPSFGVQLAGYQELLDESLTETMKLSRKGVQLGPDGKYRMISYDNPNDAACFRALLAVHNWKASNP